MSLAVAIESANGIVLAADSRATFGDPRGMTAVNDTVQKIFKPSSRTALAMVGAAEIGAAVMQVISAGLASQPDANVDVVADTIRILATQHFAQWFGLRNLWSGLPGEPSRHGLMSSLSWLDTMRVTTQKYLRYKACCRLISPQT